MRVAAITLIKCFRSWVAAALLIPAPTVAMQCSPLAVGWLRLLEYQPISRLLALRTTQDSGCIWSNLSVAINNVEGSHWTVIYKRVMKVGFSITRCAKSV